MTEADNKPWIATLTRGVRYVLGTDPANAVTFTKGVDVPVSEDTKLKLEEKAVDPITVDNTTGETEMRCKFNFRRKGEAGQSAADDIAPRPRTARRVHR